MKGFQSLKQHLVSQRPDFSLGSESSPNWDTTDYAGSIPVIPSIPTGGQDPARTTGGDSPYSTATKAS